MRKAVPAVYLRESPMIRIYNAKILTMENGMQPFDGEIQTDSSFSHVRVSRRQLHIR